MTKDIIKKELEEEIKILKKILEGNISEKDKKVIEEIIKFEKNIIRKLESIKMIFIKEINYKIYSGLQIAELKLSNKMNMNGIRIDTIHIQMDWENGEGGRLIISAYNSSARGSKIPATDIIDIPTYKEIEVLIKENELPSTLPDELKKLFENTPIGAAIGWVVKNFGLTF